LHRAAQGPGLAIAGVYSEIGAYFGIGESGVCKTGSTDREENEKGSQAKSKDRGAGKEN
jgi:hypothetical protein